jgi:DNA mismatch repair protein MutS2
MLGTAEVEFHALMADLKRQRQRHEEVLEELDRRRVEMDAERARLAERIKELEAEKGRTMEAAHREARDIVSGGIREVHDILDEAKREKSRAALKKLQKKKAEVDEKLKAYEKEPSLDMDEISEGGVVFIKSAGADAKVVGVDRKRKRVRVKLGGKDIEVPVSEVARQKGKPKAEAAAVITDAGEPVSSSISLVGLRVDDALSRLEPFLNHASLGGLREVLIVHGIGTGALRSAVREHLDGHPLVTGFRAGEQPEGGDGVTIATLR